jgi:three-Cys-motif partner protein
MPDISTTIWDIEPHTQAKHEILKRYLQAWFPIMSKWNGRILYIDGFAGPGEYSKGEPGSPLIAIDVAKEHRLKLNSELVFWFIEAREDRCEHLKELLGRIELPDNIKYEVECSKFDESLTSLFDKLDEQGKRVAPTFAFIDPFGYSDTPFSVIERIMKNKRCEVLITFMSGFLNRFKSDPHKEGAFDLLFGTTEWREIIFDLDFDETSVKKIVRYYQKRLELVAKHVRTFEMINRFNQAIYHLIFCTNSIDGLKKMNDSMWKVDEKSGFTFSDRTDPDQAVLLKHEPDYEQLKKLILDKFKGKEVSIEEVEEFVAVKGFKTSHLRKPILKPMEEDVVPPEIEIVRSPRRRGGSYPKGTIIRFL